MSGERPEAFDDGLEGGVVRHDDDAGRTGRPRAQRRAHGAFDGPGGAVDRHDDVDVAPHRATAVA